MSRTQATRARSVKWVLIAAIAATVAGFVTQDAGSTIAWRGDFETGNFSQWTWGVQEKDPSRATIVTTVDGLPPREGNYAARFEVQPGDTNVAGSGTNGERDEALIPQDLTGGFEGSEQYYAWSTLFDTSFQANNTSWNAFTQWHNTGTTGGTTGFQVRGTELWFQVWGGDPASATTKEWKVADRTNGRWYDFVLHVKWSSDPAVGFVEVWVDGRQVVPLTHTPTLYNGQGVYLKQGYYRNAQPYPAVIFDDGMRRASSFAEAIQAFPDRWGTTTQPTTTTTTPTPPPAPPAPSTTTTTAPPPPAAPAPPAPTPSTPPAPPAASAPPPTPAPAPPAAPPAPTPAPATGPVTWAGEAYTSPAKLRARVASEGASWEAFLQTHPAAARKLAIKSVDYGRTFYTAEALTRWLATTGTSYRAWSTAHPAAAEQLQANLADTPASTTLRLRTIASAGGSIVVRASGAPASRARLTVRDAVGRALIAAWIRFDAAGRFATKLHLRRPEARLTVSLRTASRQLTSRAG